MPLISSVFPSLHLTNYKYALIDYTKLVVNTHRRLGHRDIFTLFDGDFSLCLGDIFHSGQSPVATQCMAVLYTLFSNSVHWLLHWQSLKKVCKVPPCQYGFNGQWLPGYSAAEVKKMAAAVGKYQNCCRECQNCRLFFPGIGLCMLRRCSQWDLRLAEKLCYLR